jgi:AcrR family transcriptional regulator
MNPQVKIRPDDTRARIMSTAEALFRRVGYAKTAVADIAGELGMSPANIYRFFASKNAIVEAICERCLSELEEKAWAVVRSKGSARERIERLFLEILTYHKENLLELLLRDGIAAGEFEPVDPRETAELIKRSMVIFTHPILIGHCVQEHLDLEAAVRQSVGFLLRAITPRT